MSWHVGRSIEAQCDAEQSRDTMCVSVGVVCVMATIRCELCGTRTMVSAFLNQSKIGLKFFVLVEFGRIHASLATKSMRHINTVILEKWCFTRFAAWVSSGQR